MLSGTKIKVLSILTVCLSVSKMLSVHIQSHGGRRQQSLWRLYTLCMPNGSHIQPCTGKRACRGPAIPRGCPMNSLLDCCSLHCFYKRDDLVVLTLDNPCRNPGSLWLRHAQNSPYARGSMLPTGRCSEQTIMLAADSTFHTIWLLSIELWPRVLVFPNAFHHLNPSNTGALCGYSRLIYGMLSTT